MDWEKTYRHESGGEGNATDQKNNKKNPKNQKNRGVPQKASVLPGGRRDTPHLAQHVSTSFGSHSQSQFEELCPPSRRAHQSEATLRDRWPGLMNNE